MDLKTRISPSTKIAISMWATSTGRKGGYCEYGKTTMGVIVDKYNVKAKTVRGLIGSLSRQGYTVKVKPVKQK